MPDKNGRIQKGEHLSPHTEFKKGEHWRPPQSFRDKEWLTQEYSEKKRSAGDIAAEFGVTEPAIFYWLRKHQIPRRNISEARAVKYWGQSGDKNPMYGKKGKLSPRWSGGQHERMNPKGVAWRKAVLKRDHHYCRLCHGQKALQAHHIKPFGKYPDLRWDVDNGITLCRDCHKMFLGREEAFIRELAIMTEMEVVVWKLD